MLTNRVSPHNFVFSGCAQIAVSAQGGSIQLAVDAADFDQDGLLVLFGGGFGDKAR